MSSSAGGAAAGGSPTGSKVSWARARAVLEVDVVDLDRDALLARARLVGARLEPAAERDGLALDQVLGGGLGLALPEDQVDVDGVGLAVAAVAGHRDGGDALARVGGAQFDVAG